MQTTERDSERNSAGTFPAAACPDIPAAFPTAAAEAQLVAASAAKHSVSDKVAATASSAVMPEAASVPQANILPAPRLIKPIVLHMPVDVRSVSLALLALFAGIVLLRWASAVFIPLMMSVMLTHAFSPAVEWLFRRRVPRWLGAAALLLGSASTVVGAAYVYSDDAAQLVASLPVAAKKLRESFQHRTGLQPTVNPIETVQRAAAQLEQAALENASSQTPTTSRGVMRVVVQRPPFDVRDYLWSGTVGLLGMLAQTTVVLFLTFFALMSGDNFRRKMVKIAGPTLSKKKITVQVLDEITDQVQRYLLVQVVTSVVVGLLTWLAFWALGLEHAAVWGIASGVLNLIPYIGSAVVTAGSALVAFLQFGTVDMALAVGGASVAIHVIMGNLLTPWLTSRASSMSPVVVFVSILAWGWLWGIWGLLLGIPIMMGVKANCDRVEDLKPVGELLGS